MATANQKCKGKTTSGEQCRLPAGPSGYCHVHDPERLQAQEEAERERQQRFQEAERQRQERAESLRQLRKRQLSEISQAIEQMRPGLQQIRADEKSHHELSSVVDGLYVEIEKLTKKAPAEQITVLALEQINEVIKDTKALIKNDRYVQALKIFVPAGDRPELRDALLVVRQIKQGLDRASKSYSTTALQAKLVIARAVKAALEQVQSKDDDNVLLLSLRNDVDISELPDRWKDRRGENHRFNFDYLDTINIPEYFST